MMKSGGVGGERGRGGRDGQLSARPSRGRAAVGMSAGHVSAETSAVPTARLPEPLSAFSLLVNRLMRPWGDRKCDSGDRSHR